MNAALLNKPGAVTEALGTPRVPADPSLDAAGRADLSRSIIGIDTLKVGLQVPLTRAELVGWRHHESALVKETEEKFIGEVYRRTLPMRGTQIHLKYVPVDYAGNQVDLLLI